MRIKEQPKPQDRASIAGMISTMQERDSNILILHYNNNMSVDILARILSTPETEVERIITTFAEQFSSRDNLNKVVDYLIKMNKMRNAERKDASVISKSITDKDKEIAELKQMLKESEIRAEAYLEMIKVAEQTFKIPIRKKYGAK